MKKRLRRFVTILLVLTLAVSFSLPVQAAPVIKTITFTNRYASMIFYGAPVPDPLNAGQYRLPVTVVWDLGVPFSLSSGNSTFSYKFVAPSGSFTYSYGSGAVSPSPFNVRYAVGPAPSVSTVDDLVSIKSGYGSLYLSPGDYYLYYVASFVVTVKSNLFPYSSDFRLTSSGRGFQYELLRTGSQDVTSIDISDQTAALEQATEKQTDTLTNGYDNTGMNADNDRLSASLDGYEDAESQVTDQSVDFIDAVTFTDPTTHLQLMTAVTWTSTFLQNLFVALGDWSVLVTIALSLAFALMLIGWFKYRK